MRWMTSLWLGLGLLLAVPAAAQFSDSYNFLKAVREKNGAKAKEIMDKPGANTIVNTRDNDTGETGLHIATKRSDSQWLAFLLQEGANANARDREGNTALMIATQIRWTDGVRILTSIKAQIDAQNRLGETALLKAVQNRDSFTAKLLLDAGANPDLTDNSGASPRRLADEDPRATAVARLLKDIPVRAAKPVQGPSL